MNTNKAMTGHGAEAHTAEDRLTHWDFVEMRRTLRHSGCCTEYDADYFIFKRKRTQEGWEVGKDVEVTVDYDGVKQINQTFVIEEFLPQYGVRLRDKSTGLIRELHFDLINLRAKSTPTPTARTEAGETVT